MTGGEEEVAGEGGRDEGSAETLSHVTLVYLQGSVNSAAPANGVYVVQKNNGEGGMPTGGTA